MIKLGKTMDVIAQGIREHGMYLTYSKAYITDSMMKSDIGIFLISCSEIRTKVEWNSERETESRSENPPGGRSRKSIQAEIQHNRWWKTVESFSMLFINNSRANSRAPICFHSKSCLLQWEIHQNLFSNWEAAKSSLQGRSQSAICWIVFNQKIWELNCKYKLCLQVMIPLRKLKRAHESENAKKPAEKYVHLVTGDNFDFWFMGFLNHQRTLKFLHQAIHQARWDLRQKNSQHMMFLFYPSICCFIFFSLLLGCIDVTQSILSILYNFVKLFI